MRRALGTLAIPADVLEDAKVLVSELVGNSVKHAGLNVDDHVHVTAEWSGERLRVTVHDRDRPWMPPVAAAIRPRPGANSGWGLFIVDQLASRWGTDESGYWFELEIVSNGSRLGSGSSRSATSAGVPSCLRTTVKRSVSRTTSSMSGMTCDRITANWRASNLIASYLAIRDGDHAVALGAAALAGCPEVLVRSDPRVCLFDLLVHLARGCFVLRDPRFPLGHMPSVCHLRP